MAFKYCFIRKENIETVNHHLTDCPDSRNNYSSLWSNLKTKIINCDQTVDIAISNFIANFDLHQVLLLLGGLALPFDNASRAMIRGFAASAVGKIHKWPLVKFPFESETLGTKSQKLA